VEDRSRRRPRLVLIIGLLIAVLAGAGTVLLSSGSKSEAPPAGEHETPDPHETPATASQEAADVSAEALPETESPPESEPSEHEPDENGRMPVERPADSTGAAKDR